MPSLRSAALLVLLASCRPPPPAPAGVCAHDVDCDISQVCDGIRHVCVAPRVPPPPPPPLPCNAGAFFNVAGDGSFLASAALLQNDPQNVAGCGACFVTLAPCASDADCPTGNDVCIGPAASPYVASFAVDPANGITSDFSGEEVQVSVSGGVPEFCANFPAESGGVIVCPLCLDVVPIDLAIQYFDDAGGVSNAACVDTSQAT